MMPASKGTSVAVLLDMMKAAGWDDIPSMHPLPTQGSPIQTWPSPAPPPVKSKTARIVKGRRFR